MPLAALALLLLGAPLALASTECLGYLDEAGSWRLGFSCEPAFCCGTCRQRHCCGDRSLRLSPFQQKRCLVFSPKFVVGLVTAVTLFMAMVAAGCCCFCMCRYLVRRHQRLQSPFAGQDMPMRGSLEQSVYPAPPPQGFVWPPGAPPQPPLYPAGPPAHSPTAPPPYLPQQPAYPGT